MSRTQSHHPPIKDSCSHLHPLYTYDKTFFSSSVLEKMADGSTTTTTDLKTAKAVLKEILARFPGGVTREDLLSKICFIFKVYSMTVTVVSFM